MALAATGFSGLRADDGSLSRLVHVEGRVMVRSASRPGVEFPQIGRVLGEGEIVITGDQACVELRVGEAGLWRVGRRAVFAPHPSGGQLTAGAALVRVPAEAGWRVESSRGAAVLGKGLWIVQAVDNEGLKIVCLDGPAFVEAAVEAPAASAAEKAATRIKLHPGELVFLRPGGRAFGPIVTIYLEELLATSRLVNGFPEPLAEKRRLRTLGVVQRDQLKGVTNALVGGARDDQGFEIAVPKTKEP